MELVLKIDNRSKDSKNLITYLQNLSYVEVLEPKKVYPVSKNIPNEVTLRTMAKTSKGIGLTKTKDNKDLMKKLLS